MTNSTITPLPTHGLTAARVLCIASLAGAGLLAATAPAPTVSFATRGGRSTAPITLARASGDGATDHSRSTAAIHLVGEASAAQTNKRSTSSITLR